MTRPRKTPAKLRAEILAHLEDFDYELLLLKTAMDQFGEDFKMGEFKRAFQREAGLEGSLQVKAVERAFARVQNQMAQLAEYGARLAGLEPPKTRGGTAARAFESLKEACSPVG